MASLFALDYPLGPDLEHAIRRCVDQGEAFCVLDQRTSPGRRRDELLALGATHLRDVDGVSSLRDGVDIDDDIGVVMLTSGSSGRPKAVEITWDALRASATMTQERLRGAEASLWFPCLPANHIGGLAVILRAVFGDARLLWGDSHDIAGAPSLGATHVAVVRAQLARHDLSGYEVVLLGGARPPGELPDNVITTWGMTETGSGVIYNGRPLDAVQVTTINGELCLKSPTLFRSYRDSPRPRVKGPDGAPDWFPTGDAGEFRDGVVRVFGRMGYVINTGGEKVWPDDLEAVLATVKGVHDVAVTSIDDDEWGEKIVALIVSDVVDLDDQLSDAALDKIGPWAKPKVIRYVQSIPRTSNGKIRRGDLEEVFSRPPGL